MITEDEVTRAAESHPNLKVFATELGKLVKGIIKSESRMVTMSDLIEKFKALGESDQGNRDQRIQEFIALKGDDKKEVRPYDMRYREIPVIICVSMMQCVSCTQVFGISNCVTCEQFFYDYRICFDSI